MKQIHISKKAEQEEPIRVVETRGAHFFPIVQHEDDMEMDSLRELKAQRCSAEKDESKLKFPALKDIRHKPDFSLPEEEPTTTIPEDKSTTTTSEEEPTPKKEPNIFRKLLQKLNKYWWIIVPLLYLEMHSRGSFLATSCNSDEIHRVRAMSELDSIRDSHKYPLAKIESKNSFIEIIDTVIKDIPLRLYIPHNAEMSLFLGTPDQKDNTIVYISQAANIREDNGNIEGSFVLKGEPKGWGASKDGYCAIINGEITIGIEKHSSLFEQATTEKGYFFRQYPLIKWGEPQDNHLKDPATHRALCQRGSEFFIAESNRILTLYDFAISLAYLGVEEAINLVGASSFGWAINQDGQRHEIGNKDAYLPTPNTSYIVWRKK